ncbi:ankyrin repeat and fibronectin type III domain containing protein wide awake isoform 2-T2 [Glossina fuscipes fuscipes]
MKKRKATHSYSKLVNKNSSVLSSSSSLNTFVRSQRASLRRLKSKLSNPSAKFKFHDTLYKHRKKYEKLSLSPTTELNNCGNNSITVAMDLACYENNGFDIQDNRGIEEIMSSLPVPRKACKLLQADEDYNNSDIQEQIHFERSDKCAEILCNNNNVQKINALTRARTATIRKPTPYLNSNTVKYIPNLQSDRLSYNDSCYQCNNRNHQNKKNKKRNTADDNEDDVCVILRKTNNNAPATLTSRSSTSSYYDTIRHQHYQHCVSSTSASTTQSDYDDYSNSWNSLNGNGNNGYLQLNDIESSSLIELCNHNKREKLNSKVTCNGSGALRCSEHITQNVVSVAGIRNVISYISQDFKEMEYLLSQPQHPQQQQPHHHHYHQYYHCQRHHHHHHRYYNQLKGQEQETYYHQPYQHSLESISSSATKKTTSTQSSSSLSSSAESASFDSNNSTNMMTTANSTTISNTITATTNKINNSLSITRHANGNNAKNVKLHDAHQSSNLEYNQSNSYANNEKTNAGNIQNLTIYRQPANARNKGGSTPHRTKMSKKQLKLAQAQLDKLTQCNLHLHALFSAVEHGHLDKARTILESTDIDVNSINTDGLSALDVAVLSNNRSMTKMLLQHGALEGSQFAVDNIGTKLNALLKDAESRVHELSGLEGTCQPTYSSRPSISSIIIGNTGSSVSGCTGNEIEKQIGIWERRIKGLRRLLLGWDQARPPDAPASLTVDVTGDNSVQVQILEPFDGAIATKFKVQWSTRADFSNVVGERELMDWCSFHGTMGTQYQINGLTQGRRYFLRAACGNVKGWGDYKTSVPASVIPSSWRDLNNREDRYLGRQLILDNLFTAVRLARPADVSELTLDTNQSNQRKNPKKKTTIKQLFSVASKFQKHLRRGIHLASIVYYEDKVLVTSEDSLPVIEIDESYPSSLHNDYHWLMKVACSWDDVKSLRTDMERNLTSANHFRTKLLSAVCQMQSVLSFNDLGQLYYKPLRDSQGTVVLSCIQSVKSQKAVSILNSRWLPINKLQKKLIALHEEYNINEIIISSINDEIQYHQAALQRLNPGLYLGYLKLQCSMDQIQVVVPVKTPNVLPHCRVRENSHITAEEWLVLKRSYSDDEFNNGRGRTSPLRISLDFNTNPEESTEIQRLFLYDLSSALHKLFSYMNIKPEEASTHRLYDVEVIEHSNDISFLIICPAVELTCAVPGQSELLLQRDDLASLSVQAFEMIHLLTYQPGIIQKYARLSCILELDTALATQSQREAFASSELQTAKERLAKLQELTNSLNAVWKTVRWLMDVISFARDKNASSSTIIREILEFAHHSDDFHGDNTQLLQPPLRDVKFIKSGSGRGSWPGPGTLTNDENQRHFGPEHSKSEQNLDTKHGTTSSSSPKFENTQRNTQESQTERNSSNLLHIGDEFKIADVPLRKNSGDSATSQYTSRSFYSAASNSDFDHMFNMPPSRSDDTLSEAAKQTYKSLLHRKRTSSNIISMSTPITPSITVHSSNSVPYLARDSVSMQGSSHSLKSNFNNVSDNKQAKASEKLKSASSVSLRDGGIYLKTTLSALQTEMKTAVPITGESSSPKAASTKSLPRQSSNQEYTAASCPTLASEQTANVNTNPSGIIQVYTAYDTGLASGTSLKLHVTAKTTAREVINLVVKQLNMAAALKGSNGPIYTNDMLNDFCLVAVIGARERCLRDDFKPLLLQNPWKKGRMYVRQKHELLAAIEHSNRKSHLI